LVELCGRLPAGDDRRAVILISDGYDENSASTLDQALAAAKNAKVTVYVIGIGGVAGISLKGERAFKRLAAETGGRVFFPPRDAELESAYDQLAADAQNRYLVTYTPANNAADGKWRAINLTVPSGARPATTSSRRGLGITRRHRHPSAQRWSSRSWIRKGAT
jgi:VWFA-related protein